MAHFVPLTVTVTDYTHRQIERHIYLNPDQVILVYSSNKGETTIRTSDMVEYTSKESVTNIVKKLS